MRWLIGLLLSLALLVPINGWAAIALDQSTESTNQTGTSVATAFTATTGSVIVVGVVTDQTSTGDTSSISYNGGTFAELYDNTNDGFNGSRLSCHIAVTGADGASHTLTANLGASVAVGYLMIASFTGVETSSNAAAHRTVYDDGTGTGDLAITVADSQSGDEVIYMLTNWGANPTAAGTLIQGENNLAASAYDGLLQRTSASGANTAMSVTGGNLGQACAFALVPASAGGPDVTHFYKRRAQ